MTPSPKPMEGTGRAVVEPVALPWREVKEWIGRSPDSKPPQSVRARVFARYGGRCYLSGRIIRPGDVWELEHISRVKSALPGEPHLNRESNLAPALKDKHREKTSGERREDAKAERIWAKNFGQRRKSTLSHPKLKRKFSGEVVPR